MILKGASQNAGAIVGQSAIKRAEKLCV